MRRVLVTVALAALLAGCGTTPAPTPAGAGQAVTITNCDRQVTYDKVPTRVVSNDINTTEMLLALGLADHVAGYAGIEDKNVKSPYAKEFASVKRLSDKYISKEVVLGASPDLVFAGWNYGFSEASGVTPDSMAALGVPTYQLTEACRQQGKTNRGLVDPIEAAFTDLLNLGRIFGVPERAEKLVAEQRAKIAGARKPGAAAPQVFHYDCCGDKQPLSSGRFAAPNSIISGAGGRNVFGEVADSWIHVSWEEVVARRPDVITIDANDDAQAQQMTEFLLSRPELAGLPAIAHKRFFVLPYANWVSGVRNADSVVALAEFLSHG
ncbi:ABC transporter substrate-binding protein [Kutzneria viridogrisea]|uniref:Iron transport lipoprotein n=2 Tax=Kutzneria TaxID=43356 RepID=W5W1S5_9PSEU|nr:ABC transporter substrate-binding protein [Kutzneria albida]AHH94735.1 iron transport lipoprotein [Kutzneria albida DSM 43870]MBA8930404.1 iron complex transport system substrate-binding protein [Kutzneria viridogrisea]